MDNPIMTTEMATIHDFIVVRNYCDMKLTAAYDLDRPEEAFKWEGAVKALDAKIEELMTQEELL